MRFQLNQLQKKFADKTVLNNLNLDIKDQNIIGVIGPSGGGKSTLLRMIAGFESITNGSIYLNGVNTAQEKEELYKRFGFVFQSHHLFLHLNVLDNITIILEKVHQFSPQAAKEKAISLLEKFGLKKHMDKKPHQLSGGQSQRVAIIRALAIEPEVLLFDEPTNSLDPILTYEVLETILALKKENKDFIIVTHEIGFVKEVADYIIFIDQGEIIEHGEVSIIETPVTKELDSFLSKVFSWKA